MITERQYLRAKKVIEQYHEQLKQSKMLGRFIIFENPNPLFRISRNSDYDTDKYGHFRYFGKIIEETPTHYVVVGSMKFRHMKKKDRFKKKVMKKSDKILKII